MLWKGEVELIVIEDSKVTFTLTLDVIVPQSAEKGLFNLLLFTSTWESREGGKKTKYLKTFSLKWC